MTNAPKKIIVSACLILAVVTLVLDLLFLMSSWDLPHMRVRGTNYPLAADFALPWSAASLALTDGPPAAYNMEKIFQFQQNSLGASHRFGTGFFYPPFYLLILLPLGLLPYLPALFTWLGLTFLGYALVLSRFCRHSATAVLGLTFPGVWVNFQFGQNGCLTASLLGGGLLLLDSRPYAAGVLLGLLAYKPNLAFLPMFALLVSRQWKPLLAGLGTILALSGLSFLVFGKATWAAFWQGAPILTEQLAMGFCKWNLMPSVFAFVLSLGCNPTLAFVMQGAVSLGVLLGVAWVWRRSSTFHSRAAILILGALLFTPYLHVYDLAVLALPLAWLWENGLERGRLPGERLLLLAAFFMPPLIPIIYRMDIIPEVKLQIGPLVLLPLFLMCLIREKKYG